MESQPTVFVVSSDAAVRQELAARIKLLRLHSLACRSRSEFAEVYDAQRPGCVLLDVPCPAAHDLQVLQWLAEQGPHLPVVVLSAQADVGLAVRAMKLGARDFLKNPCPDQRLAEALGEALHWDAECRRHTARVTKIRKRLEQLTPGQRDVLDLILKGRSNRQIGAELGLSERSVEERRRKLMKVMQAQSLVQLVRWTLIANLTGKHYE